MADEHEKSEHAEHKPEETSGEKGGGIGESFKKHKTLWIVGGVGAAGVLLLLFMNSGGGSSGSTPAASTDTNTQGAGGAVDTSALVGSGGAPSWYNAGAAENLDYWPYVPVSSTDGTGSSKSGSSGSKTGSKSGSSKSGSKSGTSKSGTGSSKSSSGGVTHGTSHGVSSGKKTSTNKNKISPNPHAGGAHGHVITIGKDTTFQNITQKAWPKSNFQGGKGNPNIVTYANNKQALKGHTYIKGGQYYIKKGTKLSI